MRLWVTLGCLHQSETPEALASQAGKLLSNESTQHAYSAQGLDRVQKELYLGEGGDKIRHLLQRNTGEQLVSLETIRLGELALNKESRLLDVGSGERETQHKRPSHFRCFDFRSRR